MALEYKVVQWNKHKKLYDLILIIGVVVYLSAFIVLGSIFNAPDNPVQLIIVFMRAFGTCAFFMLHIILAIGPLARINSKFLPLLYNRRHFGVLTFLISLLHFAAALVWYFFFSELNPLVSIFTVNTQFSNLQAFPFELFGIFALLVLFVMASTSHDFWLKNLSPPFWKALHMFVYFAYGALVLHVALGYLQADKGVTTPVLVAIGFSTIILLHLLAALKDAADSKNQIEDDNDWHDIAAVSDLEENKAFRVNVGGDERIAVFRYQGKISAVSAVCAHQNGPLDEARIIDGCITCPWHGYQYNPENGQSPPPFTEKISTYRVRIENERVFVNTSALPPGTPVTPALV